MSPVGRSKIEWTDSTWSPVTGCVEVSEGCEHCYAKTFAERWRGVPGHPYEQGFDLKLWPERLGLPLRWRKPRRVFVNSMSDLFFDARQVPDEFVARVFATMAATPQHTYQILTKRPGRMASLLADEAFPGEVAGHLFALAVGDDGRIDHGLLERAANPWEDWPLPNVWLGVSVENQRWAKVRIPKLLVTPAAVRFLSCEPLLGPLSLAEWVHHPFYSPFAESSYGAGADYVACQRCGDLRGASDLHMVDRFGRPVTKHGRPLDTVGWVIVGGESGPGARPMGPEWARALVRQCRDAQIPVFVKQIGSVWARANRADPKGGDWTRWPEDLRVRQYPKVAARG